MSGRTDYTPALGVRWLTPLYDSAIALLTRENAWRTMLAEAIDLKNGERLLDVGCGTGSLAVRLAAMRRGADVHGIDPDPDVLSRARLKAAKAGVSVAFHEGFLVESFLAGQDQFDVIASSLVFHQVPLEGKRDLLSMMRRAMQPAGRLVIADYGLQRTALMRRLFRATVQSLDGVDDTQPNADGLLPELINDAGFAGVEEARVIPTATGSISILTAHC
ncbi:MAG: class I SAM-dependent methyltransferase [Alphaproteobacteria bacterium]|nr:class I SAM-dependent methyltransferase [Alphaproteobacteria bacterium]